jgi:hypothetical protein
VRDAPESAVGQKQHLVFPRICWAASRGSNCSPTAACPLYSRGQVDLTGVDLDAALDVRKA